MKTFNQLNNNEKAQAIGQALNDLIQVVCEGAVSFNDELNGDDLQARIDAAAEKADKLGTPWFMAEIMLEDREVRWALESMAQASAEDALYLEAHESMPVRLRDSA